MSIRLTAHWEKQAPLSAFGPLPEAKLLYHQVRTAEALGRTQLVVNSYNTGTGKTRASLLHLFTLGKRGDNVLFIAPTNALIRQHVEDIERFVNDHTLPFRVIEVNADLLRHLGIDLEMTQRSGEKLHRLLCNPLEFYRDLGITPNDHRALPFVIVVNPDIFHYMLFLRYARHDQRNLFDDVIKTFRYIVIDEFHYYDERQVVTFLTFLTFWKEWGFSDEGRKVCLLSATPNPQIEDYLGRIFGLGWEHVSPDNEPSESASYALVQTLSELELSAIDATLDEWLAQDQANLETWLAAGEDGAIISNSLARINQAYNQLRPLNPCRITGPEPQAQRLVALRHQLLLATPVVDIGYNFERDKPRQNIDFVVCEGRFRDDLIQRIGRAGRVLGKAQCNHMSRAVVLVSNEVAKAMRQVDGQTLDRRQFRDLLIMIDALPPKHQFDSYIRTHGLTAAFYPIYLWGKNLLPDETNTEIDRLYERIKEVFAPQGKPSLKTLSAACRTFEYRERWWQRPENQKWERNEWNDKTLIQETVRWIEEQTSIVGTKRTIRAAEVKIVLPEILKNPQQRASLYAFIAGQYHLTKSRFAFRDSFNGPTAALYDPERLFSSQEHNSYDLLHLIANYQLSRFENADAYIAGCGGLPSQRAEFYVRLIERRSPQLRISFTLTTMLQNEARFTQLCCRRPVALSGVSITASTVGDGARVPLPPVFEDAIRTQYLTLLIVPELDKGRVISYLRNTPIIARPLDVEFTDGSAAPYLAIVGSAVWPAHAALQRFFYAQLRCEPADAIIL